MKHIDKLVADLVARKVQPEALEGVIRSLIHERNVDRCLRPLSDKAVMARLATQSTEQAEALTKDGLGAQVAWLSSYYNNADHLQWALSSFLTMPLAA